MAIRQEAPHALHLLSSHAPDSVLAIIWPKKAGTSPMTLELLPDHGWHQICLAHKGPEWLGRRLPSAPCCHQSVHAIGDHELQRHSAERSTCFTTGCKAYEVSHHVSRAPQGAAVALQHCANEVCLPLGLLNGRGKSSAPPLIPPRPDIAPRGIQLHGHRAGKGLALDNKCAPAVKHQMVHLADPRTSVSFWLLRVLQAKVVQEGHVWIGGKLAMQVERNIVLHTRACGNARILAQHRFIWRLDDHAAAMAA